MALAWVFPQRAADHIQTDAAAAHKQCAEYDDGNRSNAAAQQPRHHTAFLFNGRGLLLRRRVCLGWRRRRALRLVPRRGRGHLCFNGLSLFD